MAKSPEPIEDSLTVKQVAAKLQLSEKTIRRAISDERLGHTKFGDAIRIFPAQLRDWVKRSTVEPRY